MMTLVLPASKSSDRFGHTGPVSLSGPVDGWQLMDTSRLTRAFVTGASGFIGSNLADRLLAAGFSVVGYDNFTTGRREFIAEALRHPEFKLIEGDVLDTARTAAAMAGCDIVFHFAANADVRFGLQHPRKDLEQNTIATFSVLEAMRTSGVRDIAFSSTGSIYGEADVFPTPETAPFPIQTSLYGCLEACRRRPHYGL